MQNSIPGGQRHRLPLSAFLTTFLTVAAVTAPTGGNRLLAQDGEPAHPAQTLKLDTEVAWRADPAEFLDGRRAKRRLTQEESGFDRGALLDQAIADAKETGRLVMWYIPRIVENQLRGRQMYRAPVLDIYMRQVLFSDPDIVGILDASFIPVRMVYDEPMAERFGMRPLDFIEPAVVFLNGAGEVVHSLDQIRTFHAGWFADLLRRIRKEQQATVDSGEGSAADLAQAGAWEAAIATLEEQETSPRRDYELAGLHRRVGNHEAAAKALAAARLALDAGVEMDERGRPKRNPDADTLRTAIGMEEAILAMLLRHRNAQSFTVTQQRLADAMLQLQNALGRTRWSGLTARRAEAGYLLGLAAWLMGDDSEATKWFQLTAQNFPDTPWGRKALANVTLGPDQRPMGAVFCGFESFGPLPNAAFKGMAGAGQALPVDTRNSLPNAILADQRAVLGQRLTLSLGALRLLEMQRGHGGFTESRYAYWSDPRITPNAWTAISALATTALWEAQQKMGDSMPELGDRIDLATRWLLQPGRVLRGVNEEIYADCFRIEYLARRIAAGDDSDGRLKQATEQLVAAAAESQYATGFWAHEYPNAFCTGAMMWALMNARDAGVDVPEEVLRKGAAALQSARSKDGTYSYSGAAGRRSSSVSDSSARMPICEGALLRLSVSTDEDFERACQAFSDNMERVENISRNDFHSDGELGGFFFFHGMFFASEVVDMLPPAKAKALKAKMAAMIPTLMELDGAFLDSHEQGRSYGTAMAMLTLINCLD